MDRRRSHRSPIANWSPLPNNQLGVFALAGRREFLRKHSNMKIILLKAIPAATFAVLLAPGLALAQQNLWTGGVGGDWTDGLSWNQFVPPDPTFFEAGVVGSTSGSGSPTAAVDVTTVVSSPSVIIGDGAGTDGTVNVTTGTLNVVFNAGITDGDLIVGNDSGEGVLNVATNGTVNVDGQLLSNTGANPGSTISLVGGATVTAGSAFFDRELIINGDSVNVAITGNATFGFAGNHSWVIPAAGASTISVGGNADLGGNLVVDFSAGKPAVGSTFDLIDATTVDDNEPATSTGFGFVDTSSVSGLGAGERFATQTVAGGTNGNLVQLVLEQQPVLVVDRSTGVATISNPASSTATIGFDTYAITSPTLGILDGTNWNSFEDQAAAGAGWLEGAATANAISEINPIAAGGSIAASTDVVLGSIVNIPAPASFGEETEDLVFQYSKPTGGFINGDIVFVGAANNTLTLNVDPTTGEAQIVNGTSFTVAIDTYIIDSASGSLDDTGWSSLESQGADGGNWFEGSSSANQLSELLVTLEGRTLAPNDVVNLGFLYDEVSGVEDLSFRFSILPSSVAVGDFNGDGIVNGGDYAFWRNNLGTGVEPAGTGDGSGILDAADLPLWAANFGATGGGGSSGSPEFLNGKLLYDSLLTFGPGAVVAGVPEPTSALLALAGVSLTAVSVRRRD